MSQSVSESNVAVEQGLTQLLQSFIPAQVGSNSQSSVDSNDINLVGGVVDAFGTGVVNWMNSVGEEADAATSGAEASSVLNAEISTEEAIVGGL